MTDESQQLAPVHRISPRRRWSLRQWPLTVVLIALGGLVVMVAPTVLVVLGGFVLLGLGCATLVPAAFAAAHELPGLGYGTGVALVGWLMRAGFVLTSPALGAIADGWGLRAGMVLPLLAGLVAVTVAVRLRRPATVVEPV